MRKKIDIMSFIFCVGLLLLLFSSVSTAQSVGIGKWRAGSARELVGNIYTLIFFVSGPNDEWSTTEKQEMMQKLNESQQWLQRQAKHYNVEVNFEERGQFGLDKDIKLPHIVRGTASGTEPVDWVSKLLYAVGYTSTQQFIDWVEKNTKAQNTHVVIFVKGKGNGYAMPSSIDMDRELYFLEGTVLYEEFPNGYELPASAISHEILHLYGAWDFYKTFRQTAENEAKAKKQFPNSIMLRTSYYIDELEVDEVSAWRVGWHHNPKSWYLGFEPPQ